MVFRHFIAKITVFGWFGIEFFIFLFFIDFGVTWFGPIKIDTTIGCRQIVSVVSLMLCASSNVLPPYQMLVYQLSCCIKVKVTL